MKHQALYSSKTVQLLEKMSHVFCSLQQHVKPIQPRVRYESINSLTLWILGSTYTSPRKKQTKQVCAFQRGCVKEVCSKHVSWSLVLHNWFLLAFPLCIGSSSFTQPYETTTLRDSNFFPYDIGSLAPSFSKWHIQNGDFHLRMRRYQGYLMILSCALNL